jgi:hypothetical protein
MRLSSLTYIGFETNAVWDTCPDFELSFSEVYDAAEQGCLVELLKKRFGDVADLSLFELEGNQTELEQVEAALKNAAEALQGREKRKVGVRNSGICLVMAIIFEAIQQQFSALART